MNAVSMAIGINGSRESLKWVPLAPDWFSQLVTDNRFIKVIATDL
jgi:hypothetical protein